MIESFKLREREKLVILSREDGEGPRKLRAAFITNSAQEIPAKFESPASPATQAALRLAPLGTTN